MNNPKKRRAISLAEKKTIIEAAETESNKTKLAERFGIKLGTLCGILKEKEVILEAIDGGSQAKRVHLKAGKHNQLEEALIIWHKQVRSNNVPVSGDLMKVSNLTISFSLLISFDLYQSPSGKGSGNCRSVRDR